MVLQTKQDNQKVSEVSNEIKVFDDEKKLKLDGLNERQKSNKKYMKVSQQTKQQLHQMVQKEGKKIKEVKNLEKFTLQAARILGIKYATAKTIVFHNRQKRKEKGQCGIRMCGYTEMMENRVSRLQVKSIIGNEVNQHKEYIL